MFCRSGLGRLFKDLGLVDDFIEINKKTGGWKSAQKSLKERKYNLIISMHQSFRTAFIVSQLSAEKKIGFNKWWNFWVFQERVQRPMYWPEALRQLKLISLLDSELAFQLAQLKVDKQFLNLNTQMDIQNAIPVPEWASCSIKGGLENVQVTLDKFKLPSTFVVISPGSVWPTKRWTEQGFTKLVEQIKWPVVLSGSPDESELCKRVATGSRQQVHNLCGQSSLLETLHIMSRARVVVSNDSGAQHMAAATETPVVSIFGPTTLSLGYRPWYDKIKVAELDLNCRPCGKHGAKKCPLGTHECMEGLTSESVLELVNQFLD